MNTSSTLAHHPPAVKAMTFIKPSQRGLSPTAIDPPDVAKFIVVRRAGALLLARSIS